MSAPPGQPSIVQQQVLSWPHQSSEFETPCTSGMALRVEERGLSITWSALRVSYAMGGDGESDIKADLRHFAAFVRDPGTVVTCLLLPFSCSMHLEMQVSLLS